MGEILEDKSGEHCGYVVVPKGVKFSDLKMEMTVDKKKPEEAVLAYTYEDNLVGSARAKLSEKYLKEHRAEIKKQEKKAKKADASDGKNLQQRLIVVGLAVLFLVLILLFIAKIRQYRRRLERRRRRHRRRSSQQNRGGQSTRRRKK